MEHRQAREQKRGVGQLKFNLEFVDMQKSSQILFGEKYRYLLVQSKTIVKWWNDVIVLIL